MDRRIKFPSSLDATLPGRNGLAMLGPKNPSLTSTDVDQGRKPASDRLVDRSFLFAPMEGMRPLVGGARYDKRGVGRILIGRGEERKATREQEDGVLVLKLLFPSRFLSGRHAGLHPTNEGWVIEDLGSTNGTFVNGQRVKSAVLKPGDIFEAGRVFFQDEVRQVRRGDTEAGLNLDLDSVSLASRLPGMQTLIPAYATELGRLAVIARASEPVTLIGETGSGKEVMANAIHALSGRKGPFCAINCAAIPSGLVESELFGHRRGAFSGATGDNLGHFRAADGGTLLLDEILRTELPVQHKLLRALDQKAITPVGSTASVPVDVRIIAASQEPLGVAVERRAFQADLQARLEGYRFHLLPLRERRPDIGIIAAHLLGRIVGPSDQPILTPAACLRILRHTWPLNVRALEKSIRSSWLLARERDGEIDEQEFPVVQDETSTNDDLESNPEAFRERIDAAMKATDGVVARAAEIVGCHRRSLYRYLDRLSIDPESYKPKK